MDEYKMKVCLRCKYVKYNFKFADYLYQGHPLHKSSICKKCIKELTDRVGESIARHYETEHSLKMARDTGTMFDLDGWNFHYTEKIREFIKKNERIN